MKTLSVLVKCTDCGCNLKSSVEYKKNITRNEFLKRTKEDHFCTNCTVKKGGV